MPITGISTIFDAANATVTAARNTASRSSTPSQTRAANTTTSTVTNQSASYNFGTSLNQRIATARNQEEVHLERIIVLDNAKNEYTTAISRLDSLLLNDVERVNSSIRAVNQAYQERINSGCRTDLFWRLTDINVTTRTTSVGSNGSSSSSTSYKYTYQCTRITPTGYPSVGDPPPPTNFFSIGFGGSLNANRGPAIGSTIGVSTTTVEYVAGPNGLHEEVSLDSLFGFQPVNLYSLKMYDEPYTRDIGETFVTSFIGTCAPGSNYVIAMTPNVSGGLNNIVPGQLLTCSKLGVFNSDAYVITGVGTAIANLSGINTTARPESVNNVVVPKITLDDIAILPAYAPEDDGNYVTFTVLIDPDNLGNLGVSREASPYVPQTIKCPMTFSDRGRGVRVEFDNSGAPSGSANWNQFLEGQPDPNARVSGNSEGEIRQRLAEAVVREPAVGSGRIFHKIGFEYAPVIYTNSSRTQYRFARVGETVVLSNKMGQPRTANSFSLFDFGINEASPRGESAGVVRLPSCSSTVNELIVNAERTSAQIISSLSSSSTQNNIQIANMLREDLSDINVRIWSERQLLEDARERQGTYNQRLDTVNQNSSLINGN